RSLRAQACRSGNAREAAARTSIVRHAPLRAGIPIHGSAVRSRSSVLQIERRPPAMHVKGRDSSRHMKGRQVALTLYLPPQKYWLLKATCQKSGVTMQHLLRTAVDQVLTEQQQQRTRRFR